MRTESVFKSPQGDSLFLTAASLGFALYSLSSGPQAGTLLLSAAPHLSISRQPWITKGIQSCMQTSGHGPHQECVPTPWLGHCCVSYMDLETSRSPLLVLPFFYPLDARVEGYCLHFHTHISGSLLK